MQNLGDRYGKTIWIGFVSEKSCTSCSMHSLKFKYLRDSDEQRHSLKMKICHVWEKMKRVSCSKDDHDGHDHDDHDHDHIAYVAKS